MTFCRLADNRKFFFQFSHFHSKRKWFHKFARFNSSTFTSPETDTENCAKVRMDVNGLSLVREWVSDRSLTETEGRTLSLTFKVCPYASFLADVRYYHCYCLVLCQWWSYEYWENGWRTHSVSYSDDNKNDNGHGLKNVTCEQTSTLYRHQNRSVWLYWLIYIHRSGFRFWSHSCSW